MKWLEQEESDGVLLLTLKRVRDLVEKKTNFSSKLKDSFGLIFLTVALLLCRYIRNDILSENPYSLIVSDIRCSTVVMLLIT